jgi:hypothetical protein
MRFSGDQTLVGVFQGTTGCTGSEFGGAVDAKRYVGIWRRHRNCDRGLVLERADIIRGGGIVVM